MNKKNVEKDNTFGRLIGYIFKHYAPQLIVTIICIIIAALASVIATIFLQRIIDEVITPAMGLGMDSVWNKFIGIIITMGVIYILGVIASFTYTRLMANVTQGTLMHLRNDMFERMQTLPIKYFDTNAHGDIMSTYTNDTDAIRQLIGQSLPQLFQSSLTIIGIVIMMCFYSFWLTIVVGLFIFLMTRVVKNFGGNSAKYMMAQQRTLAKEEGFVEEMMEGAKVIKVFNHEEESKNAFNKVNEELFEASEKANKFGNMLMPTLGNIGNIMYVVLAVVGGLLVYYSVYNLSLQSIFTGTNSVVSLGIIISFLSMSRQLSQTVGQVSMQVSMIAMGLAGARRVFELMDQEPEFDEGYVTLVRAKYTKEGELVEADEDTSLWAWKHPHKAEGTVTYTPLKGDIVLEDVDFGYVKNKLVLHDVSLYAKPGQKIAFVGATGAGKTTITNLINRFYDIEDGKIRYDGININKIKKTDLRRSLGIVLQDVNLFTGTVLDNIRYGKLNATDEECIAAAKLANAHHFIERLPDGYNTMLTANGANLSQGQRQLLSIARAAVANPPVMILDEATSSIDTRTEAIVQAGMDNLMFGRTVFVIAHRLSTVRNSKAIMVLDHGRIIERGDHDTLIDQKGTYYQLYTGAFELE
ncbi:ABC transporter ATP-binding protein [Lachnospira multipara]|uniref:ABC transporter ATP-binding protein n=1 Tax=Lachnospira multipara TaxID=28051 RepID=UPI00041C1396|nr:ABC transporter ATP-binding protein [Lachnospira multipara]